MTCAPNVAPFATVHGRVTRVAGSPEVAWVIVDTLSALGAAWVVRPPTLGDTRGMVMLLEAVAGMAALVAAGPGPRVVHANLRSAEVEKVVAATVSIVAADAELRCHTSFNHLVFDELLLADPASGGGAYADAINESVVYVAHAAWNLLLALTFAVGGGIGGVISSDNVSQAEDAAERVPIERYRQRVGHTSLGAAYDRGLCGSVSAWHACLNAHSADESLRKLHMWSCARGERDTPFVRLCYEVVRAAHDLATTSTTCTSFFPSATVGGWRTEGCGAHEEGWRWSGGRGFCVDDDRRSHLCEYGDDAGEAADAGRGGTPAAACCFYSSSVATQAA